MQHKFTIPGTLPGLNEYISAERSNKYQAAQMKKQAEHVIIQTIKAQLRNVTIHVPIIINYLWVEKNARRDKDNIAFAKKFIQDGLVKAGIIGNDGWEWIDGFTDEFSIDKKNPRVEVLIKESTQR